MVLGHLIDGEDGPNGHVHVYVRGAIEGIEEDDVLALAVLELERDGLGMLFGPNQTDFATTSERTDELLVCQHVEFLLHLALDVHVSGVAKEIHQPGLAHVAVYNFGCSERCHAEDVRTGPSTPANLFPAR